MRSIMHNKAAKTCYLCMMLHSDYTEKRVLHEHHVFFGTANRRLSEKYGLKVYLCVEHHETGKEAVHQNRDVRIRLEKEGQKAFEREYPTLSFLAVFGMNRLDDADRKKESRQQDSEEPGFYFIESGIGEPKKGEWT